MAAERPVWVTGAGGFLGAAVCRRLLDAGLVVRPLLRRESPRRIVSGSDGGTLLEPLVGDLAVEPVASGAEGQPVPASVVHFAAEIPAGGAPEEVADAAERNRRADDHVFAFAARVGAGVVFASSGAVYGDGGGELFVEDGPVAPASPYAAAKLRSEESGAEILGDVGLPFVALRISAPYGPGLEVNSVTRVFLTRALAGEPLTYHGSGSREQDFVYVADVADAAYRAVAAGADGVFNIAGGVPVSMRALAETIVEVVGGNVRVVPSGTEDPQEGRRARYSIDAAAAVLDWRPMTSLRHGLALWRDALRDADGPAGGGQEGGVQPVGGRREGA
jgi:nucleoside-diphosphate-sugar epimerase